MTTGRVRQLVPAMPRPAVLLAAVGAATLGTAVRDLGTGLLGAAAVLVLAARQDDPTAAPPAWPDPAGEPGGQVGHPLVTDLVTDLERADRDSTVLHRLDRRAQQVLPLPVPGPVRRVADLRARLDRSVAGERDG